MDDNTTIVDPSSSVKTAENENVVENYQHVQTTLYCDSEGMSVIWRFKPVGNPDPSNMLVQNDFLPKSKVLLTKPEIYTTKEVAKSLGCSRKKVRKLITDGFLEALPGGPPYRITKESLERYLRGQSPRKSPDPSASDVGSAHVAAPEPFVRKSVQRPVTGITTRPGKPSEAAVQRAVEDMKSWKD